MNDIMQRITIEQVARWTARVLGILIILSLMVLGVLAYNELGPPPLDRGSVLMFIFFLSTSIGIFIAWKNERAGVVVLALSIIVYAILASIATGNFDPSLIVVLSPWILVTLMNYLALRLRVGKQRS